jgi:hypothetical protein
MVPQLPCCGLVSVAQLVDPECYRVITRQHFRAPWGGPSSLEPSWNAADAHGANRLQCTGTRGRVVGIKPARPAPPRDQPSRHCRKFEGGADIGPSHPKSRQRNQDECADASSPAFRRFGRASFPRRSTARSMPRSSRRPAVSYRPTPSSSRSRSRRMHSPAHRAYLRRISAPSQHRVEFLEGVREALIDRS